MGKTTNRVTTEAGISFIPTTVTWDIPNDGTPYNIQVPIENMRDDLNFEIDHADAAVSIVDILPGGYVLSVTLPPTVPVSSLKLIVILPGGATNVGLQGQLANNETARIAAGAGAFAVIGNDDVSGSHPPTNLTVDNIAASTLDILSSTGSGATVPSATVTKAGLLSAADKTKLDGIATGATANDTDANLKNRANHTGTQLASTISDFESAVSANAAVTANTAKVSNVPTSLSVGTKTATTLGITSDGSVDDVVLPQATATEAGLLSAADKTKLDGIGNYTNYKLVKSASDLPAPVGGVHTLVANTYYDINGQVVIGTNRIVMADNTKIAGLSAFADSIVYTGTGNMFTVTDCNVSFANITLVANGAGSKVFNATNAAKNKNFVMQDSVIASSVNVGLVDGFENVLLNIVNHKATGTGWEFKNTNNLVVINTNMDQTNTGTQVKITAGTMGSFTFRNCLFDVPAAATGLDIAATAITITNNGNISGCVFAGAGTKTTGFTVSNSPYTVRGNAGLQDFRVSASMIMTGNTTEDLNIPGSTPYKISGSPTLVLGERVDMPVSNRLRSKSKVPVKWLVNIALATKYTSGAARLAEVLVYKNGSLISGSQMGYSVYASEEPVSTNINVTMNENDYIEVWQQKFGGAASDDFLTSYLNVQVTEG